MAYTAIDDPSAYFKVQLYTGDGGSPTQAITFDDTDTDMQPDLVWIKNRDTTDEFCLFDSVRGATKRLDCATAFDEVTDADTLTSFDSDGFALGADVKVNTDAENYVAWCWKESATAGFDIVGYTGNGSARTISHSLSAVPHFIIVKHRTDGYSWRIYHKHNTAAPETDYLYFDAVTATADDATTWNDTAPTSSVFSVGTSNETNENTANLIAYLFTEKQGFSKFGTHTGNNNADGPFIYTGFRPAWIMIKRSDGADNWVVIYNKVEGYNVTTKELNLDVAIAEGANSPDWDILSNGFKKRSDDGDGGNVDGGNYIYAAFAEAPFVNSNGVPCNAR